MNNSDPTIPKAPQRREITSEMKDATVAYVKEKLTTARNSGTASDETIANLVKDLAYIEVQDIDSTPDPKGFRETIEFYQREMSK